jgi:hypothetical protein
LTSGGGPSGPPEIIINVGGSTVPNGSTREIIVNLFKNGSNTSAQANSLGLQA